MCRPHRCAALVLFGFVMLLPVPPDITVSDCWAAAGNATVAKLLQIQQLVVAMWR